MIGKVRVTDSHNRVCKIKDEPLYLGLLAIMLHTAASNTTAEEGMNIAGLLDFFSDSDHWPRIDVSPTAIPDYPVPGIDDTNNFSLHCETWGHGVVEIFRKNEQFTHVGFQLAIEPALLRTKRRQEQCVGEIVAAAKEAYGNPVTRSPLLNADSAALYFRDVATLCFLETAGGGTPRITFRVWNRQMWDPDLSELEMS